MYRYYFMKTPCILRCIDNQVITLHLNNRIRPLSKKEIGKRQEFVIYTNAIHVKPTASAQSKQIYVVQIRPNPT